MRAHSTHRRHRRCLQRELGAALAVTLAALLWEVPAAASACCGSSYGLGARLAPAEDAAVTVLTRNSLAHGSWDAAGKYRLTRSLAHELRVDLTGLLRINDRLQVGASIPMVSNTRWSAGELSSGQGLGDASLSGQFDLIPVGGQGRLPGVGLTLGLLIPTGRSPREASDPLGTDATGTGNWELRPGIAIERSWLNGWFVAGGASLALRPPMKDHLGRSLAPQPRLRLMAAAGPTIARTVSIAVGAIHEREAALTVNGVPVPHGERARTSLMALTSWELGPHWTLVGAVQADLPAWRLGRNEEAAASVTLGVRHVWLNYD